MAKKEISAYKKLMAAVRKDISKAKMKGKKVKSECTHHGKKFWIKKVQGKDLVFRCTECRTKLDFTKLEELEGERDKIAKYIKTISKDYRNILDIAKILHNKKDDAKIIKYISEIEFGVHRLQDYLIAMIAEQFEPQRKKKKGKKNKHNSNGRIMGGGRSLIGGRK